MILVSLFSFQRLSKDLMFVENLTIPDAFQICVELLWLKWSKLSVGLVPKYCVRTYDSLCYVLPLGLLETLEREAVEALLSLGGFQGTSCLIQTKETKSACSGSRTKIRLRISFSFRPSEN